MTNLAPKEINEKLPDFMNMVEEFFKERPSIVLDVLVQAACIRAHFEQRSKEEFLKGLEAHWTHAETIWHQAIVRVSQSQPGGSS